MSDTDILSVASLLFWWCRVHGFYSFKVSKSEEFNRKYLRYTPRHYFISAIFQIMFVLFSFFDVYNYWTKQSNRDLFALARMIHQCTNAILYATFCTWSMVHHKQIEQIWQNFYNAERGLRKLGIILNHRFLKRIVRFQVVGAVAAVVTTTIPYVFKAYNDPSMLMYIRSFVHHYRAMALSILVAQHIIPYVIISAFLKGLENVVEVTLSTYCYARVPAQHGILEIAKCHQRICE